MPCAAPCDPVPCSKRCSKSLARGCRCPSACGEVCPPTKFCQNCGKEETLNQQVEYLEFKKYNDVDLDLDPVIVLNCGHVFTISTLDGLMDLAKFYKMDENDLPIAIQAQRAPNFSEQELKCCPNCRGSLRKIGRYGRIVRRAQLDESTKKFISWSNAQYRPMGELLTKEHENLVNTAAAAQLVSHKLHLTGERQRRIQAIRSTQGSKRYGSIFSARRQIMHYLHTVKREEQPYQKVRDMVEAVRRRKAGEEVEIAPFDFDQSLLQTRASLLATALAIRCDLNILSDVLAVRDKPPVPAGQTEDLKVDFSHNRTDCEGWTQDAEKSFQVAQVAEGHVYWARFAAMEVNVPSNRSSAEHMVQRLIAEALAHLDAAETTCKEHPSQTRAVLPRIEPTRKMLDGGVFYTAVSNDEMRAVVAAMETEFRSTGHWYRCANGHPFTVGECELPMQLALCPRCGAAVGGQSHQAVEGVTRADDIEGQFARMEL